MRSKLYMGIHVKHGLFLSDFNKTWIFSTDFRKILKCQISWKSLQWERSFPYGQTERHTDMMNLTVVFRSFSNASKTRQPASSCITYRVRRNWSRGQTLEMFVKVKGRIYPVLSYAPCYEVNRDSGGVAPHINTGNRCRWMASFSRRHRASIDFLLTRT
jgi:hypothetical protein